MLAASVAGHMRTLHRLTAAAFVTAIALPAAAVDFDATGNAQFAGDALFTYGFESNVPTGFGTTKTGALEGATAGTLPARKQLTVSIDLGSTTQAVTSSFWARGGAVEAYFYVLPTDAAAAPVLVPLFVTGRVTSDGWYELASSPFSVDAASVANVFLYFLSDDDADVALDAVEVKAGGDWHAAKSCAATDPNGCGAGEVCRVGVCREADAAVPPLPSATDRPLLAAMFESQLDSFYGGVDTRAQYLAKAHAALEKMPDQTTAFGFWSQLLTALHELHDAHTFGYVGYTPYIQTKACFVEGDADLTHDAAPSDPVFPDILVSHGASDSGFSPGDRLVAVDGMHPDAWMRSLKGVYAGGYLACDDDSHSYETQSLAAAIPVYATTITLLSCAGGTCGQPHDVDVRDLPTTDQGAINCDQRIGFHFASGNPDAVTHVLPTFVVSGQLADTTDDEALYGMTFDSFYPDGTADPFTAAVTLATTKAKGFLIDHRPGGGGYGTYATELTTPFRPTETLGASSSPELYGYDASFDKAKGKAFVDAVGDDQNQGADVVGSASPKPGLKGALLIANGESSGDFFPWEMQGPANVRIFGRRTQGAFSTAYYLAFGPMKYGFGSGDTFLPDGTSKTGHGQLPDEEVLPKQSDILQGKDTAYERALAWLRGEGAN